jgi:hypothetical protein
MLALWEFFWTEADWTGGSVSATAVVVLTPGRGSGKGRGKEQPEYQLLPDEYWEHYAIKHAVPAAPAPETIAERQQRLIDETRKILAEQDAIVQLQVELTTTKQALRDAADISELKSFAAHTADLQQQLDALETTNNARIIRAKSLRFSLYN